LGKEAQAFQEARPIAALEQQPDREVENDERKRDELDKPV
jgi:hypothetical protein